MMVEMNQKNGDVSSSSSSSTSNDEGAPTLVLSKHDTLAMKSNDKGEPEKRQACCTCNRYIFL
jgi:hypothetical protein